MNTEILRMLSPDAIEIGKPGGGWAALSPQDVAAALSGLATGPYYLAMSIHVIDPVAYAAFSTYVVGMRRVPREVVKKIGRDPIRNIIDLCVDELWGDNMCGTCRGAGLDSDQRTCANCNGAKYKKFSDMSRASQARVPHEHWPEVKGLYQSLYTLFTDWNSQIQTHIRKRYSDEKA